MRISKLSACFGLSVLLAISCLFAGQTAKPENTESSCRAFVQAFYSWYIPKGSEHNSRIKMKSSDDALKYRRSSLAPELYRRLKEDSDASAKNPGEIVGLDFDPFVNSQDPCDHYVVGNISVKGDSYWVNVHGVCQGKRSKTPDVIPELIFKDGKWLFVNIHYSTKKDDDLLSVLKQLREERSKKPR